MVLGRHQANSGCTSATHTPCSSCGATIIRRQAHVHTFDIGRRNKEETLCETCYGVIVAAALPVLRAAMPFAANMNAAKIHHLLREGFVQVLSQGEMPLVP